MTKTEAHAILDQIKNGNPMPLALTNQALEWTGDLCRPFSESLRTNGNEPQIDRSCQAHGQTIQNKFSWSGYLDSQTVERNQC